VSVCIPFAGRYLHTPANIHYISQNQTSPFYGACLENDKTTIENGFGKGN
jgi:hypothetical protein